MSSEFRSSIVLDAKKATDQAVAFGNAIKKSSTILDEFQRKTKAVTQGGAKNVFREYENSANRLNVKLRNSVARIHDSTKGIKANIAELSKLTDGNQKLTKAEASKAAKLRETINSQKHLIKSMNDLNVRYDENALAVRKISKLRSDLNLLVASGLQTQRQAVEIFNREALAIKKNTTEYKKNYELRKKAVIAKRTEKQQLTELASKYSSEVSIKRKIQKVTRDLNRLEKSGVIDKAKKIRLLDAEIAKIKLLDKQYRNLGSSQSFLARTARNVSIASRIFLGAYIAMSSVRAWVNLAKTAESVELLDQKLVLFTGDSGAYNKFFQMTQEVGIKLQDAGKIMTRFAVVTKQAFSIETMNSWVATLTKSARATGTSTQEMTGALIQITQAMSAGRLMGDEYRSVTENLPLLTVALRKLFKDTGLSLKELSSKGLITTDKIIEGFEELEKMVEGIPGTVGTVEAKLSALSSAWDNMIRKMVNTKPVKLTIQVVTDLVNGFGGFFDTPEEQILQDMNKSIKSYKEAIRQITHNNEIEFPVYDIEGNSSFAGFEDLDKLYLKLNKAIGKRNQFIKNGNKTEEALEKERLDRKLKDAKTEEMLTELAEKNARDVAKARGSESIFALRKMAELRNKAIIQRTKFDKEKNPVPLSKNQAQIIINAENKKLNEEILKIQRKSINEKLKNQGMSTSIDLQNIENEKFYSGNVLEIKEKFAKDLEKINTQIERGRLESSRGLNIGDTTGISEEKGAQLLDEKEIQKAKSLEIAIVAVRSKLKSLLDVKTSSETPYQKYVKDIQSSSDQLNKDLIELNKTFSTVDDEVRSTLPPIESLEAALKSLNEVRKEEIKNKAIISLEGEFAQATASVRNYELALIRLNDAKKLGVGTSAELAKAEQENKRLLHDSIVLLKAQNGELSFSEQASEGFKSAISSFAANTKTDFEIIRDQTKSVFDNMGDAIVEFVNTGKFNFKDFARSVVADLLKIQAQQLLIRALSGFGFADGGAFGPSGIEPFAKGGAFTNKVVNQPTLFPFANGTGVMGEAGPEAIMPLARNSNGELGVKSDQKKSQPQQLDQKPPIVDLSVFNFVDKEELVGSYMASEAGKRQIVNVIKENPELTRR